MFDDILIPHKERLTTDPIHKHDGKWYFWDEVWAHRIGPFGTEELARHCLILYVKELEEGPPKKC